MLRALSELGFVAPAPSGEVVPGSAADALFDAAAKALKMEALGPEVAKRMPIGALGMLDYALITSGTLREGLERTAKYYRVATQRVKLELVEEGPLATLRFERQPGVHHSRHWIEFSYGIICERIRGTIGSPTKFAAVSFTHPAPSDARAHDAFFGTKVQFGAPRDALSFEGKLLGLPLQTASSSLAEVLEMKMKALEPAIAGDDFMHRVQATVLALLERQDSSLQSAASRLAVSRRTLQRELQRRGTSHQELVDEARRGRARELLEGGLTVAEVSDRLGFSEPSAFFRAFRRWTGHTPKEARKS